MHLEPNMNMAESLSRYGIMMIPVIVGGLLGNLWIMLLGLPIFLTAISAYCPLYQVLGINHAHTDKDGLKDQSED
jgi:hypothetical protein